MAIPVIMPKQGQSVETCIITRWYKNTGDSVKTGDLLFSYETDKAAFELESPGDGFLLETFFDEGAEVPVLMNVAVIGQKGESVSAFIPGKTAAPPAETAPSVKKEEVSKQESAVIQAAVSSTDSRIKISPRAKRLAENKGLNYNRLQGSGPNGRIIVNDIEKALSGSSEMTKTVRSAGTEFTEQPLSNVRKLIAKAMYSSLQNSAQLTHHMSADVRRLLETRSKIKAGLAAGTEKNDITLNDMICWCVIRALKKFPEANSHFLGDSIKTFHKVHLGIAVDTSRGLMVPAVKNAEKMNLPQLSKELKMVADACRKGNIDPELIKSTSATFTVSNLGNYGVEMFTPVINLPQAAILGVCTIIYRPADLGNNTFGFVPYIGLSLTYDHRAIDGGPATLFLKEIKEQIESFNY
ncbi:MAG: dihydrolipoamide acetyltransferase family protein [Bacteroidia bacterium]|jgi:pyruvate dehydrogenase E2 component (dihydrolipoamide acetyltransferase)|nr:dihydrolipoamide acetyltransferase family protein [Bacteroidia bacterium]